MDNELEIARERRMAAEAEARSAEAVARTAEAQRPRELESLLKTLNDMKFSQSQIKAIVDIANNNCDKMGEGEGLQC